jgi:hypothetical protein
MQCPQCQHENSAVAKFCEECGTRLARTCPSCGHEVRPQAKFCEECGTSFTASTSAFSPAQPVEPQLEAESRFHAMLRAVVVLLQHEKRIMHRELKHIFRLDDGLLEEIREALTLKRLAIDEDDKVLVWIGETQPAVQQAIPIPSQPVTAVTTPPVETEAFTPSNRPTVPAEVIATDVPQDDEPATTESARSTAEASG